MNGTSDGLTGLLERLDKKRLRGWFELEHDLGCDVGQMFAGAENRDHKGWSYLTLVTYGDLPWQPRQSAMTKSTRRGSSGVRTVCKRAQSPFSS